MPRKKLQHFQQIKELDNVWELGEKNLAKRLKISLKKFSSASLELGCGKGEYTIALAKQNPQNLYIGIDLQGERLWFGAQAALENKLSNVLFLRIEIEKLLDYFPKYSVDQIWITFPDPQPKKRTIKKRLSSPRFLEIYKKILKKGGEVNLKTDDQNLFLYSQNSATDFGAKILNTEQYKTKEEIKNPLLKIETTYEQKKIAGQTIYYLQFNFKK